MKAVRNTVDDVRFIITMMVCSVLCDMALRVSPS
jgi:hypothetical protein